MKRFQVSVNIDEMFVVSWSDFYPGGGASDYFFLRHWDGGVVIAKDLDLWAVESREGLPGSLSRSAQSNVIA
ncbi:MAG: hypothetical protein JRN15_19300 [Nitrososphaerota archaeon]|nr:hypothetical protein [Nitrososphaerota archaeon]